MKLINVLALQFAGAVVTETLSDGRSILYVVNPNEISYENAETYCSNNGGRLPIPMTQEENDFLYGLGGTWLGFSMDNHNNLTYTNWRAGEPNGPPDAKPQLLAVTKWDISWNGLWNDGLVNEWAPAVCYLSTSERGFEVSRNNLYDTIQILNKQWALSVYIMPTGTMSGWSNVLHVGVGGDHAGYGDRTPGIWIHDNSTRLHVASAVSGDSNYQMNTENGITMNAWTRVEVSQFQRVDKSYEVTVMVGDDVLEKVITDDPQEFKDVKVFTGDNYYAAAKARIDDLRISTFADGITESFTTVGDLVNDYSSDPIISIAARLMRKVRFSIQAESDIQISLSTEDPVTSGSWEVVLGEESSVIRSNLGVQLAHRTNTKAQFLKWQQNFDLKVTKTSVGLFDSNGEAIIESDQFDVAGVRYLYIATEAGSTGRWIINQQNDGFKHDRDPVVGLNKVVARFVTFMDENLSDHATFVNSITLKLNKLAARMIAKYEKLNGKCDMWSAPQDEEENDALRYDQQNPCKAPVQVSRALMKWANVYNVHCKSGARGLPDRLEEIMSKITIKFQKKLKYC